MNGFEFAVTLAISALIFALPAVLFSLWALKYSIRVTIEMEAFKKSTHSIQMVPVDKVWENEEKEVNKRIDKNMRRAEDDLDEDE